MEPNIWEKQADNSFDNFFLTNPSKTPELNPKILLDRIIKLESRQRELESTLSQKVK